MSDWKDCKHILCIRADNMGDLLMSSPAIRALKETFGCRITLLTSSMANLVAPFISQIDETIVANLPWIKTDAPVTQADFFTLVEKLKKYHFDAAVIFTVYSQNPLPAAMLAYLADIPMRLAYCRENPYYLLTDWVVEREPLSIIRHQVERDLEMVKTVGATTANDAIIISIKEKEEAKEKALVKLKAVGVDPSQSWMIIHPGVSEKKREYPEDLWVKTAGIIRDKIGYQVLVTGSGSENLLCNSIAQKTGGKVYPAAGVFDIEEFIALVGEAPVIASVNTGTVHIAAAVQTPVVVLYALTNPQHTPWRVASEVLYFSVKESLKSKNQIVDYVSNQLMDRSVDYPSPEKVANKVKSLLAAANVY